MWVKGKGALEMDQHNLSNQIMDMIKDVRKADVQAKNRPPTTEEYVHIKRIMQMICQGEL